MARLSVGPYHIMGGGFILDSWNKASEDINESVIQSILSTTGSGVLWSDRGLNPLPGTQVLPVSISEGLMKKW